MARLTLEIKAELPSTEKIQDLAFQLEEEMRGTLLTAASAFEFTEKLKQRVLDLVVIEVSHPALNGK